MNPLSKYLLNSLLPIDSNTFYHSVTEEHVDRLAYDIIHNLYERAEYRKAAVICSNHIGSKIHNTYFTILEQILNYLACDYRRSRNCLRQIGTMPGYLNYSKYWGAWIEITCSKPLHERNANDNIEFMQDEMFDFNEVNSAWRTRLQVFQNEVRCAASANKSNYPDSERIMKEIFRLDSNYGKSDYQRNLVDSVRDKKKFSISPNQMNSVASFWKPVLFNQ